MYKHVFRIRASTPVLILMFGVNVGVIKGKNMYKNGISITVKKTCKVIVYPWQQYSNSSNHQSYYKKNNAGRYHPFLYDWSSYNL